MMDPNAAGGGDWMAGPGQQQQQQLWSEPMKQEQDGFWKHQPVCVHDEEEEEGRNILKQNSQNSTRRKNSMSC